MSEEDQYFDDAPVAEAPRQPWQAPLLLLAAALVVALAVETVQLVDEHARLAELRTTQEPQVQQATKFREQLQSLAGGTARLADGGDAAAKQVVETLRQQGITIKAGDK
jgi:hypothetical protein